jgi:D-proline reductase (dithiol) PrdB
MLKQNVTQKLVKPFIVDNAGKEIPWQPLRKPLQHCRVALVTTAGVHLKNQEPFNVKAKKGDPSFREIPANSPLNDYQITHTHYDHTDADKDINCVFPITRLMELAEAGFIGGVSSANYGFMGFILNALHETLIDNAGKVARELVKQETDVVLLTPG